MKPPVHLLTRYEISDYGRAVQYFARCGYTSAEKNEFSQNVTRAKADGTVIQIVDCDNCLHLHGIAYAAATLQSARERGVLS